MTPMTSPRTPTAASPITTTCSPRMTNELESPWYAVMMSTATQKANPAETAIRRPWVQCDSIAPSVVDRAFVPSRTRGGSRYGNRNLHLPHRRRRDPLLRRQRRRLRPGDLDRRPHPDDLRDPRARGLPLPAARAAVDGGAHRRPRPHPVLAGHNPLGWRTV